MVIELKLYDEDNEVIKTLRAHRVKWATLKEASVLQSEIKDDFLGSMDRILDVVADVFNGKATRDEIQEGAGSDEILAAFFMVTRGTSMEANKNFLRAVKTAENEK